MGKGISIIDRLFRKDDVDGQTPNPIAGIDQIEGLRDALRNAGGSSSPSTNLQAGSNIRSTQTLQSQAVGQYSQAFGKLTKAFGIASFAAGEKSIAQQNGSIAMGYHSQAIAPGSIALGYGGYATNAGELAIGGNIQNLGQENERGVSQTLRTMYAQFPYVAGTDYTNYTANFLGQSQPGFIVSDLSQIYVQMFAGQVGYYQIETIVKASSVNGAPGGFALFKTDVLLDGDDKNNIYFNGGSQALPQRDSDPNFRSQTDNFFPVISYYIGGTGLGLSLKDKYPTGAANQVKNSAWEAVSRINGIIICGNDFVEPNGNI